MKFSMLLCTQYIIHYSQNSFVLADSLLLSFQFLEPFQYSGLTRQLNFLLYYLLSDSALYSIIV
jgi:hypothetical protein